MGQKAEAGTHTPNSHREHDCINLPFLLGKQARNKGDCRYNSCHIADCCSFKTRLWHIWHVAVLGGLGCDKVHARLQSYAPRKQFLHSQIFSLHKLDRQKVDKIFISEQVNFRTSKMFRYLMLISFNRNQATKYSL